MKRFNGFATRDYYEMIRCQVLKLRVVEAPDFVIYHTQESVQNTCHEIWIRRKWCDSVQLCNFCSILQGFPVNNVQLFHIPVIPMCNYFRRSFCQMTGLSERCAKIAHSNCLQLHMCNSFDQLCKWCKSKKSIDLDGNIALTTMSIAFILPSWLWVKM